MFSFEILLCSAGPRYASITSKVCLSSVFRSRLSVYSPLTGRYETESIRVLLASALSYRVFADVDVSPESMPSGIIALNTGEGNNS